MGDQVVTLFNLEGTRRKGGDKEIRGDIAQLGERLPCKQEVAGSIPTISTTYFLLKKKVSKENFHIVPSRNDDGPVAQLARAYD